MLPIYSPQTVFNNIITVQDIALFLYFVKSRVKDITSPSPCIQSHTRNRIFVHVEDLWKVTAKTPCTVIPTTWLRSVRESSRGDVVCLLRHRTVSHRSSGNQALLHSVGRENEEDFCSIFSPRGTEEGWPQLRPEALVLPVVTQRSTLLTSAVLRDRFLCDQDNGIVKSSDLCREVCRARRTLVLKK